MVAPAAGRSSAIVFRPRTNIEVSNRRLTRADPSNVQAAGDKRGTIGVGLGPIWTGTAVETGAGEIASSWRTGPAGVEGGERIHQAMLLGKASEGGRTNFNSNTSQRL